MREVTQNPSARMLVLYFVICVYSYTQATLQHIWNVVFSALFGVTSDFFLLQQYNRLSSSQTSISTKCKNLGGVGWGGGAGGVVQMVL